MNHRLGTNSFIFPVSVSLTKLDNETFLEH